MNRLMSFFGLILLLGSCSVNAEVNFQSLLKPLRNLFSLAYFRNYTTHQFSSYDRSGGNGDAQNFLWSEGNTAVLAEMKGPGAVVRIWSANASADHFRIYLDNQPQPVIDLPFFRLFDGSTSPFLPPLALPTSGGFVSYLPIPYAKSCRITVENPRGLYYHIAYIAFPPTTKVRTFRLPLKREEEKEVQKVIQLWNHPGPRKKPPYGREEEVPAGEQKLLKKLTGPATIELLNLKISPSQPEILRKLVLRAFFDHHLSPDIEAPVADFFGNAYGGVSFRSLLLGQEAGEFYCLFPMPFAQQALFFLENGNQIPIKVSLALERTRGSFEPRRKGYFHARFRQEITRRGQPHRWLTLYGRRGHFVGVVQAIRGRGLGFLEGDEQFRVDNEQWLPSQVPLTQVAPWNGTGTEDYYNSGWYFNQGPIALPSHGAVVRQDEGKIAAYRWHLNDTPTFWREITAQIEHGGANDAPGTYYASVVYWYDNGEVPQDFPMVRARDLKLPE